jgi:L-lactate dehydrogenase (cytochrome)
MRDEVETTMRLLGVTKLSQLGPHLVSLHDRLFGFVLEGWLTDRMTPDALQLNTKALDPLLADSPMYAPGEQVK